MVNKLSSANTGGWNSTILGEVAEFINGDRGKNYPNLLDRVENGVPFINTGHIEPTGWLSDERMDYITLEKFNKLGSGKVRNGDIVYCLRGSTIGKTARNKYSEGAIASSLIIIRAKKNISQDYLYYFLTSPFGQSLAKTNDNGSAQPNLSGRVLSQYPIKIPSYNQQCAIADYLNSLDNKIQLNQQTNQTLEQMAQALFKSWFVDFDPVIDNALAAGNPIPDELRARAELRQRVIAERTTNPKLKPLPEDIQQLFPSEFEKSELGWTPKGWKLDSFSNLATLKTESVHPNRQPDRVFTQFSLPAYDKGKTPTQDLGIEIKSGKYKVSESVVLVSKLNPSTPRVWLPKVIDAEKSICSTEFMPFEPIIKEQRTFIFSLMCSENIQSEIASRVTGTTGSHQRVSPKNIAMLSVILPSESCINLYCETMTGSFSNIGLNLEQNVELKKLRDLLLPKLISGELQLPQKNLNNEVLA